MRVGAPIIFQPIQHQIVPMPGMAGRLVGADDVDDIARGARRQIRSDVTLNEVQNREALGGRLDFVAQLDEFTDDPLRCADRLVLMHVFQRRFSLSERYKLLYP
jgi:hypothetical protein